MTSPLRPARTLFVTGTDTGVGKTRVGCALIRAAIAAGWRTAGFKPVASGAELTDAGLRNEDALQLRAAMGGDGRGSGVGYESVNPYCFEPPIAPHLAARAAGRRIARDVLDAAHDRLAQTHDVVIVEGAGGWQVPLNEIHTFADWVGARGWPVVLVVALRLGCLNHALLSAESILSRTRLAGWIATMSPPVPDESAELLADLGARLPAPCWGVVEADAHALRAHDDGFAQWLRTGAGERPAAAS
jgi:dethiobiotin synthetase